MKIPYLDLTIQYNALETEITEMTQRILKSGQYILGPEVMESEKRLAEFTGAPYCVTAASGTDAILMALLAQGIKAGDEVIVPAFSFFATAGVIALIGAKPIFVDIDEETFNIDLNKIEKAITRNTKAIMPVSLYGQTADMNEINMLAKKHGIIVIEDAAQSFGAMYLDKMSCNLSRYGCTSFFPAKPLGCFGDGGAVFCQTKDDYERLVEIRTHGQESRYHHTRIGFNCRLDTLQCGILLVKLKRYPWEIEQRQRIAHVYDSEFKGLASIQTPVVKKDRTSVYAQYTVKVKDRNSFQNKLMEEGVPTSIHYPKGMHQQPAVEHLGPFTDLSKTETICEEVISLPLYADMPDAHVEYVVSKVKKVLKS